MKSYDYAQRRGVYEMTWERFAHFTAALAEQLAQAGVQAIVGIARAGLFPATAVSCALRQDLFPVRVTRRVNDEVKFTQPVWKVDVSPEVAGKVIAVVDEMADTGATLALVSERVKERGAARVVGASLCAHTWASPLPECVALVTDALVLFPWDRRVYLDGTWQPHPEVEQALRLQPRYDKPE